MWLTYFHLRIDKDNRHSKCRNLHKTMTLQEFPQKYCFQNGWSKFGWWKKSNNEENLSIVF